MQLKNNDMSKGFGGSSDAGDSQSNIIHNRVVADSVDEGRLMQLCKIMEDNEPNLLPQFQRAELNASLGQNKQDEIMIQVGEVSREFSSVAQPSFGSLGFAKPDNNRTTLEVKDRHEPLVEPSLSMTLGTSNFVLPFSGKVVGGREQSKTPSPSFESHRQRPILPKPLKPALNVSESNKGVITQMRIARPPGEGRGKNQLLPRYWPRITDQELEQLSGEYPYLIHKLISLLPLIFTLIR